MPSQKEGGRNVSNPIYDVVDAVGKVIISNKAFLTELDQAIGDGDHGINMARGFEAVSTKLQTLGDDKDLATVFKTIGMTLISSVGGASGPLYGTAFMRAAGPCQGKFQLDGETIASALAAAITGIKERGKAVRGEKTMLDALEPALEAFEGALKEGKTPLVCLEAALEAAKQGVEYTKTIVATKGRASYVGERSIGHQDAGATSACLMLQAVVDYYKG